MIVLGVLYFAGDSFWYFGIQYFDEYLQKVVEIIERSKTNFKQHRGRSLSDVISNIETSVFIGIKLDIDLLPEYKFYTTLVGTILSYSRNYGVPIRLILISIKKGLLKDIQFGKKISAELFSGVFQFIVVILVTWGFIFISCKLVPEISPDLLIINLIVFLQIVGLISYVCVYLYLKRREFNLFDSYFFELYALYSLSLVGISVTETLKIVSLERSSRVKYKKFIHVDTRLERLIIRWKETGITIKKEVLELIDEVWFLQESAFINIVPKLAFLKFCILAIFFLSSFLIYIFSIFSKIF